METISPELSLPIASYGDVWVSYCLRNMELRKKHGIKKLSEKLWFKDRRGRTNGVSKTKRNSALEIPWFVKTT